MYFISMTNIETGSQHCVNIILCLNQNAAVFYSTVKCETDLHMIAEDRLLTTKKISKNKSNKKKCICSSVLSIRWNQNRCVYTIIADE